MKSSVRNGQPCEYANDADFCKVFRQHLDSLYVLALLLTANQEQAERGFAASLEDCFRSHYVFRDWAPAWAKRSVIQNAIRLLKPCPPHCDSLHFAETPSPAKIATLNDAHWALGRILTLEPFRRFVLVMSVLERYSDHECALLLSCSAKQVREARIEALRDLPDSDCAPSIANTGAYQRARPLQRLTTPHQIARQGALQ